MLSDWDLQQIAKQIQPRAPGGFAFCVDEQQRQDVYYVADGAFQPNTPDSCLVRLVQEMASTRNWKGNPTLYFCKTGQVNKMEQGMLAFVFPRCNVKGGVVCQGLPLPFLKLANCQSFNPANQIKYGNLLFNHPADYQLNSNDQQTAPQLSKVHRVYMMAAYALLADTATVPRSYNVAAILVGPDGRIVSYGVNQSYMNFTCHAEVNALQGCLRNGIAIPAQSILYTTLQPCCMCAGMMDVCMPQGRVIYSVNDIHYNGPSDHMKYTTTTPMSELGSVGKPLTTWKTGRVYNKIGKQRFELIQERLDSNLGAAQNTEHQGIEYNQSSKYSVIQYLNKEGSKFNASGSEALTRKKEKYRFNRTKVALNPYVQMALEEVIAFLSDLKVSLITVEEEWAIRMVNALKQHHPANDEELWTTITGYLLAIVEDQQNLETALWQIEHIPDEFIEGFEMDLKYKRSLPIHRGASLYS
jgi:tRNA(Arg) A34 adenosine deaminase TadA